MPEGPEIYLASTLINRISKDRLYGGRVVKSEVSTKNPDVDWDCEVYRVSATARGKELKVILNEGEEDTKNGRTLEILFRFGMSGSFKFTPLSELPKHAHLRFFTISEPHPMVLSFVDYRRFGRWEVGADWSPNRGPDPMWEYPCFREKVLANLKKAAFNKPICEALLNQEFFNGIGNYLRAEILYRCKIPPFEEARYVLSELKPISHWYNDRVKKADDCKVKMEVGVLQQNQHNNLVQPDLLDFCHILPKEVINLTGGKGYNVDLDAEEDDYAAFRDWLQCYYKEDMKNLVDSNKRTIWFSGAPGRLAPKGGTSRGMIKRKKKKDEKEKTNDSVSKKKKIIAPENGMNPEKDTVRKVRRKAEKETVSKAKIKTEKEIIQKVKRKTDVQKVSDNERKSAGSKVSTKSSEENGKPAVSKSSNIDKKETVITPLRRSSRRQSSV